MTNTIKTTALTLIGSSPAIALFAYNSGPHLAQMLGDKITGYSMAVMFIAALTISIYISNFSTDKVMGWTAKVFGFALIAITVFTTYNASNSSHMTAKEDTTLTDDIRTDLSALRKQRVQQANVLYKWNKKLSTGNKQSQKTLRERDTAKAALDELDSKIDELKKEQHINKNQDSKLEALSIAMGIEMYLIMVGMWVRTVCRVHPEPTTKEPESVIEIPTQEAAQPPLSSEQHPEHKGFFGELVIDGVVIEFNNTESGYELSSELAERAGITTRKLAELMSSVGVKASRPRIDGKQKSAYSVDELDNETRKLRAVK